MKKLLFTLFYIAIVAGLAVPISSVSAQSSQRLYGMAKNTADIYEIVPDAGTATFVFHSSLTGSSGTPNGCAFDAANNRLYYATLPTPTHLYFNEREVLTTDSQRAGGISQLPESSEAREETC